MKVFLSWSGERSRLVAKALYDWLPDVIQSVDPWLSSSDIEIGARWAHELELQLKKTHVGIICLTPENMTAPWLLYEVGALSKSLGSAYVCPYLFGFPTSQLQGPLIHFQAATADQGGTRALIHTLNRALGENAISDRRLEKVFDVFWPHLERKLRAIASIPELNKEEADIKPTLTSQPSHKPEPSPDLVELYLFAIGCNLIAAMCEPARAI